MFDLIPFRRGDRSLFSFFDDFEKSFFNNTVSNSSQFRTDIIDQDDKYLLKAELPGFNREDIQIDLNDNYLTISARRSEEKEESKDNFIRRERKYGSFSRSFDVNGIQTDKIAASYKDGVLTLELPKAQPEPLPPSRQIEIIAN